MNLNKRVLYALNILLLSCPHFVHPIIEFAIINDTDSPISLDGYVLATNRQTRTSGIRSWPHTCLKVPCNKADLRFNQIGIPPVSLSSRNQNELYVTLPSKSELVEDMNMIYHFDEMLYYVVTMHDNETGALLATNLPAPIDNDFPKIENGDIYTITTKIDPQSKKPVLVISKKNKYDWQRTIKR